MNAKIRNPAESPEDLNDVALLVRVVQVESFTKAAAERGVPVSTVSRRIARLEARLGARLLERTTRSLRLTEVGRAYFAEAERAVDSLVHASQQVRAVQVDPRGNVRITSPVALGPSISRALASYLLGAPQVTIELDVTERRVDLLAEGFDIAVRAGNVDSPDFVARKLYESTRQLVASPAYLNRRGYPRTLAELHDHHLVASRVSSRGAVWDLYEEPSRKGGPARRHRFAFKPRMSVTELGSAMGAALAGIGIALIPSRACNFHLDSGTLQRVLPRYAGPRGGMWVMYRAHHAVTAAVRTCAEHLVRELPRIEEFMTL